MPDSVLQTVDRALQIIEMLGREAMTAKDIQMKLDLNKTTVHRLMMTLLNRGFVERNEATGIYQIGLKLIEISSIRLNQIELKTEAVPFLHQLANKVNQSVQLAILDENQAVFIEKVEKYQSFHMYCQTGKRIPLYCSAVGKCLLLDKSDVDIRSLLDSVPMNRFTSLTLTNTEDVLEMIHLGRKEGFTRDNAEHEPDVYCVAAPIFDYRGTIVASASITGFDHKIFEEEGKWARDELINTCYLISKRIGYSK